MMHFEQFRGSINDIFYTKHFRREAPLFDAEIILKSEFKTHLHKYEENIEGNHIFRALIEKKHYVYAIDKNNNLIMLRVIHNFKEYKKYLENKKEIEKEILSVVSV